MSYQNEDQADRSKSRWIEDTHEHRRSAMEVRQEIPPEWAHIAPFDVPELVDYYNRLLHQYAAQLRPKQDSLHTLWSEHLTDVEVPPNDVEVDVGTTDVFGGFDGDSALYKVEWEERPVSLDSLQKKWASNNQVHLNVIAADPNGDDVDETISKTLYLPPHAANLVLDQLNQCLDHLGWLPETTVTDETASEDEVLTHQ